MRTLPPTNSGEKGSPVAVAIGRYCFFSRACELRPPGKIYRGFVFLFIFLVPFPFPVLGFLSTSEISFIVAMIEYNNLIQSRCPCRTFSYFPLKIGDHVFVGAGSIIEAAMLGNHVHIGANVVVGKFVIVKDFVKILDGTVVPPGMVIPSLSVVGGCPGRVVGEVAEGEIEGMDLREVYRGVRN